MQSRERRLVGALDRAPLARWNAGVVGERLELAQLVEVGDPALADASRDAARARRGLLSARKRRGVTPLVMLVKLLRPQLGEVAQHGLACSSSECSAATPLTAWLPTVARCAMRTRLLAGLVDQRQPRARAPSSPGKRRAHLVEEAAVDLVDDLEVPRQQAAEQRQRPGLERLGQQRVVGVGERARA